MEESVTYRVKVLEFDTYSQGRISLYSGSSWQIRFEGSDLKSAEAFKAHLERVYAHVVLVKVTEGEA